MNSDIKIINDYPQLNAIEWRQLVTDCPHCESGNSNDVRKWYRKIDTIVLNNQYFSKPAYFIIISECPDCGEKSWNHFRLKDFALFADSVVPQHVVDAVKGELNRRELMYHTEWTGSLCINCIHLDEVSNDNLYFRVGCLDGGRSGGCTNDCDKFNEK